MKTIAVALRGSLRMRELKLILSEIFIHHLTIISTMNDQNIKTIGEHARNDDES